MNRIIANNHELPFVNIDRLPIRPRFEVQTEPQQDSKFMHGKQQIRNFSHQILVSARHPLDGCHKRFWPPPGPAGLYALIWAALFKYGDKSMGIQMVSQLQEYAVNLSKMSSIFFTWFPTFMSQGLSSKPLWVCCGVCFTPTYHGPGQCARDRSVVRGLAVQPYEKMPPGFRPKWTSNRRLNRNTLRTPELFPAFRLSS